MSRSMRCPQVRRDGRGAQARLHQGDRRRAHARARRDGHAAAADRPHRQALPRRAAAEGRAARLTISRRTVPLPDARRPTTETSAAHPARHDRKGSAGVYDYELSAQCTLRPSICELHSTICTHGRSCELCDRRLNRENYTVKQSGAGSAYKYARVRLQEASRRVASGCGPSPLPPPPRTGGPPQSPSPRPDPAVRSEPPSSGRSAAGGHLHAAQLNGHTRAAHALCCPQCELEPHPCCEPTRPCDAVP